MSESDTHLELLSADEQRLPAKPLREGKHWTIDAATGCWLWTGSLLKGYGIHRLGRAHRVVYRQHGHTVPDGWDLHHKCKNPQCVNPDHMEPLEPREHDVVTWLDPRGLTADDIREIRRLGRDPDYDSEAVGKMFGITGRAVRYYWRDGRWADVAGEEHDGPINEITTCAQCGGTYERAHRNRRYCSERCKRRAAYVRSLAA